jgi:hypothetical protein
MGATFEYDSEDSEECHGAVVANASVGAGGGSSFGDAVHGGGGDGNDSGASGDAFSRVMSALKADQQVEVQARQTLEAKLRGVHLQECRDQIQQQQQLLKQQQMPPPAPGSAGGTGTGTDDGVVPGVFEGVLELVRYQQEVTLAETMLAGVEAAKNIERQVQLQLTAAELDVALDSSVADGARAMTFSGAGGSGAGTKDGLRECYSKLLRNRNAGIICDGSTSSNAPSSGTASESGCSRSSSSGSSAMATTPNLTETAAVVPGTANRHCKYGRRRSINGEVTLLTTGQHTQKQLVQLGHHGRLTARHTIQVRRERLAGAYKKKMNLDLCMSDNHLASRSIS